MPGPFRVAGQGHSRLQAIAHTLSNADARVGRQPELENICGNGDLYGEVLAYHTKISKEP